MRFGWGLTGKEAQEKHKRGKIGQGVLEKPQGGKGWMGTGIPLQLNISIKDAYEEKQTNYLHDNEEIRKNSTKP